MKSLRIKFHAVFVLLLSCSMLSLAQDKAEPITLESAIAIEDPNARITALQQFLKTKPPAEQSNAAREATVTSWAQLAEAQLSDNNIEKAVADFRKALAALPENITDRFFEETVIRIPLAASVRGYRNEAIDLARRLEKRFDKDGNRLAALGEFFMTIEAPADAIRTLEMASKLAENEARLHRALGAAYRMSLRLDDAIAEYQQATGLDKQDRRAYYELANLYRAYGAYADAIKLYRQQLEIEPKHTPSLKGLALVYTAQGNEAQATASLNQARDLRGTTEEITQDIYLQTQLAFHYLKQGKWKLARQASEAALLVEPRYAWARIAAAEVDLAEGKVFEAERNLLAASRYANFPTLYFTFGKLYLSVEDFDGALEQFAKALRYSAKDKFVTQLGGTLDVKAENLRELLAREHQAAIFLAEAPTTDEQFKLSEALVRFNFWLREIKTASGETKSNRKAIITQKEMEALDQAALDFVEAENTRRSFRSLYIAQKLSQAGLATGLAVELAEQALDLAEVATEADGSLRDYPNYDRAGRLHIFRGRALDAKGWSFFKAGKNEDAIAALNQAVEEYGKLPERKRALWHLATVKEAMGGLDEALTTYYAAYEPAEPGSRLDVSRVVIESLYRKVNGSLDGLESKIGKPVVVSTVNVAPPKNEAKPPKSPSRSPKTRESKGKTEPSNLATPPKVPVQEQTQISTAMSESSANEKTMVSGDAPAPKTPVVAPSSPKPIILPEINLQVLDKLVPFADLRELLAPLDGLVMKAVIEDIPPDPPAPKTQTRKRRVTVPEGPSTHL